jgi:hypothetical protein
MNQKHKAALEYLKYGFNPFPVKEDKKPYFSWSEYQTRQVTSADINRWWDKYPNANVAIITGEISNLTVLDIDTEDGWEAYQEFESNAPTVHTPGGGKHVYFRYVPEIATGARKANNWDWRGAGGYVVAPPSTINGKSYTFDPDRHISKTAVPKINDFLKAIALQDNIIDNNSNTSYIYSKNHANNVTKVTNPLTTSDDIFSEGSRDQTLFHLANCLLKGGMPHVNIEKYLRFFARHCNPPFPEKDISNKIKSALNREENREKFLSDEVLEIVMSSHGVIKSSFLQNLTSASSRQEKKNLSKILSRLCDKGILERVTYGEFRRVDCDMPKLNLENAVREGIDIIYPLDLHHLFRTMPKNIICFAGTQDSGKTAFMLNIARLNINRGMRIRYCSSEMGETEIAGRVANFKDFSVSKWEKYIETYELTVDPRDAVEPDSINILDYVEISSDFSQIAAIFAGIYHKLKKGIAIVCLQMSEHKDYGRGDSFSMEKPRLYVTLKRNPPEGGIARIVKAKNWADLQVNPNWREINYKIYNGIEIQGIGDWVVPWKDKEI